MNWLLKIILISIKVINYWLLVIPTKLSFFAFIGYNALIYFYFGEIDVNTVKRELNGLGYFENLTFFIFFGIPYVLSFFSMFSQTTSGPGNSIDTTLDRAIAYRNGQMDISTPNKAYEIYRKTAHLDVIKANANSELGGKVARGFVAEMRNAPPQEIYKKFVD
jgi:hypothetical protein